MNLALGELRRLCNARGIQSHANMVVQATNNLRQDASLIFERRASELRRLLQEQAEQERLRQAQELLRLAEENRREQARLEEERRRLQAQREEEERRRASQPIQITCNSKRWGKHAIMVVPTQPVSAAVAAAKRAYGLQTGFLWHAGAVMDVNLPFNHYPYKNGDTVTFSRQNPPGGGRHGGGRRRR